MPDHTFVIAAYEESPYLEDCILSLKAQTAQSHIVISTATPNSFIEQLATKHGIELRVNNAGVQGIAHDWNFALSQANTPLVTIAHQDDIYEPAYTENIISQMAKHAPDKVLIAFTDYTDLVNNQTRKLGLNALVKHIMLMPFLFNLSISNQFLKKLILCFGDPICCPSVTFNKVALCNFLFSEDYQCVLDWFAWHQLAQREGAFLYISKKLIKHRIHALNATANQIKSGIRQQEERRIFELIWGKRIAGLLSRIYKLGHKDNF